MNPTLESLESRQLLSGASVYFGSSEGPPVHLPPGWYGSYDASAGEYFGQITYQNDETGEVVHPPQVKADGSVSLQGTSNPDHITVERVSEPPTRTPEIPTL